MIQSPTLVSVSDPDDAPSLAGTRDCASALLGATLLPDVHDYERRLAGLELFCRVQGGEIYGRDDAVLDALTEDVEPAI